MSLGWKQWRLRRRLQRQLLKSEFWKISWMEKARVILEYPTILVRNATIPPVEADSWSKTQAAVSVGLAPLLVTYSTNLLSSPFLGTFLPTWVVAAGAGLGLGPTVYLTTHISHPPGGWGYALGLTMVAFSTCVAWIYMLAGAAVDVIQFIGSTTSIPSSVLGLTALAWANSVGDMATNLAISRAGYPGMAIAGSYGGPLFNVLVGLGLPLCVLTVQEFPKPVTFELDTVSSITAWATVVVLLGTLGVLISEGFVFPSRAPMYLLGSYGLYLLLSIVIVTR
ncbi:unnamed protein product [Discosporangium mesarthrocarpum]